MKTFVSIGSGPGMGQATAERFAREGFRVILTSRETAKLADCVARFRARGYAVEAKRVDAGKLDSVASVIKDSEAQFRAVDVLHFNSASIQETRIETQPAESVLADFTINIGAAFVATQQAARGMVARGSGTILLTGGGLAQHPHPNYLSLSIGKAGVRNMVWLVRQLQKSRCSHSNCDCWRPHHRWLSRNT